MNPWRSIDTLPELGGPYNIAFDDLIKDMAYYSPAKKQFFVFSRRGYAYSLDNVKYWCEIPLLPEESNDEVNDVKDDINLG